MKILNPFLFPPLDQGPAPLALRPLLVAGMVTPVHDGDGGVNIAMVTDNESGLLSAIDPYGNMMVGDKHDIFWNNKNIASREVEPGEKDQRLFIYLPTTEIVPDWAEPVFYRLTRAGTNDPEDGTALRLRVKLDRPAGTDRDPHLPGHSELARPGLPQDVIDNGVDAGWAARGVPVEIEHYPGRAAYDTIQLRWGSVSLFHEVTESEAGGTVSISMLVDQATILAAGDSDALLVHYQIFDEVWNYSTDWSLRTTVAIDAGAWRLDAPIIQEAINGTIDLIALGKNDVTVMIAMQGAPFAVGDAITMTWIGTPATGLPVIHTETVTITNIPSILPLKVPNADVRAIAGGLADASYVLNKANGDSPQSSKRAFADVVGDVSLLPAPTIRQLIGDVLEPDTALATVLIPVYPGMANGDLIDMVWLGTMASGTPYVHEQPHIVTSGEVGRVIPINVPNTHIAVLDRGSLDLYYRVSNDNRAVYAVSESDHSFIRVQQVSAQLPAPKVVEAPDGVLDPVLVPDHATLLIDYLGTAVGDELTWYWTGKPGEGTGSDWVPITTPIAGRPITFRILSSLITPNIGSIVKVRYSLKRKATGQYSYSATLDLTIGSLVGELPAPQVLEAAGNVLDPMAATAGVTVRVSYASMDPALDRITLKWVGTPGTGSSIDQELPGSSNGYVEFPVAASVVGPNIGKPVDVSYEVQRYGATSPSEVLRLTVSDFVDPENQLPLPRITQANDNSKELILDSFTGNANVTVGKWPFSATGQRVWLRLVGTGSAGAVTISLLAGVPITAGQVTNGLNEQVPRTELQKLTHDTPLTVVCNVTFDGSSVESSAIEFPVARYTFKTFDDSVAPTISSVTDSKGPVLDGGTTYDREVALTGTAAADQQVQIFDGTTPLATVTATGVNWTYQITGMTVKVYSITAKGLYGNEPVSAARTFTVATATAPTISSVTDSKGPVLDGGTTYDREVALTGTAAAGQQVQILDGTTPLGTVTATGGNWRLDATGLTAKPYSITAKGLYGNEPVSAARTFTVATATAPTITSVRDSRGEVPNGGTTYDTYVDLTGTAASDSSVQIYDGASLRGTPSVTGGAWSFRVTGLAVGGHSITARGQYGNSPARGFTVAVATPPLTIDTSLLTLNGRLYVPVAHPVLPINWPAGSTAYRRASGGRPAYTYTASNSAIITVSPDGFVGARANGSATVTVRDLDGRTASYPVNVSNVVTVTGLGGPYIYKDAVQLANSRGLRIPNMAELRAIYATYGSSWPQGNEFYWSSDPYSSIQHWVKNLVTGVEGYGRSTVLPPWTYCLLTAL